MNQKQRVRLLRRLRESRNRAAHREKTWKKFVEDGREKWSKKAIDILHGHNMWKHQQKHRSSTPEDDFERVFFVGAKQATPEMLNWAVKTAGKRHKAFQRYAKSMTKYLMDTMKRPGFARQVLTPQ